MRLVGVVVLLAVCSVQLVAGKGRRVQAQVDGVDIEDEDDLADALGVFGVNLVTDSSSVHGKRVPNSVGLRARDIKGSNRLQNSAVGYILQFGYLEVATEKTETELIEGTQLIGERDLKKALRKLQKFYNLKVTGTPTAETILLMSKDRCGAKDVEYEAPTREKRYTLSRNKWYKNSLRYWFDPDRYTADLPQETIKSEFEDALGLWAAAANISFVEVETADQAEIKISFDYGDHGDGYPFYGPGGTLAHAFYPRKGLIHFDDAEEFTAGTINGINLHFVATHELGHILGIKHADASMEEAVMYALYRGYSDNLELHEDDKLAAVDALGAGSGTVHPLSGDTGKIVTEAPPKVPTPGAEDAPACISTIDAAFHWDYNPGYVYLFSGDWYYRLKPKNPDSGNLLPIYDTSSPPKRIGIDGFIGLPRHIDALVEALDDPNQFYAFKGATYYKYNILTASVVTEGLLSELWSSDTPAKIDGALKVNGYTLGFLVGDRLYKYRSDTDSWIVGKAGSNYFNGFSGLHSLSLGFYRRWTWVIQGTWYSVAKSTTGVVSSNYAYRPIANDIKLPMCQDGVGSLTGTEKSKCKKELKRMYRRPGYVPTSLCKDFVAEKYKGEVVFARTDFD